MDVKQVLYIVLFLHQTTTGEDRINKKTLLYIVLFLHQTTTCYLFAWFFSKLYIVLFLHQTTTFLMRSFIQQTLYIVLFLHQTTTPLCPLSIWNSCISYYSYIKPQLLDLMMKQKSVVYRTIPTSNHNYARKVLV